MCFILSFFIKRDLSIPNKRESLTTNKTLQQRKNAKMSNGNWCQQKLRTFQSKFLTFHTEKFVLIPSGTFWINGCWRRQLLPVLNTKYIFLKRVCRNVTWKRDKCNNTVIITEIGNNKTNHYRYPQISIIKTKQR